MTNHQEEKIIHMCGINTCTSCTHGLKSLKSTKGDCVSKSNFRCDGHKHNFLNVTGYETCDHTDQSVDDLVFYGGQHPFKLLRLRRDHVGTQVGVARYRSEEQVRQLQLPISYHHFKNRVDMMMTCDTSPVYRCAPHLSSSASSWQ